MKKIVLLFLIIVSRFNAQSPWVWARSISSPDYETARCITTDPSGNIFAAGRFTGPSLKVGTFTLTNIFATRDDIFLAKYDPNGNAIWAKSFGGMEHEDIHDIAIDSIGNCTILGEFASPYIGFGSFGFFNSGPSGTRDIFLVKLDSVGNVIWATTYGGNGEDYGFSFDTDTDGNIFFTGSFSSSSIALGTFTLNPTSSGSCFIAKSDPGGNIIWAQNSGSTGDIATDKSGCAYLTGSFSWATATFGTITFTNTSFGSSTDAFIVKYDPDGASVWGVASGGNYSEEMRSIKADKAGNIYFTGNWFGASANFGGYSLSTPGIINSFVGKITPYGAIRWIRMIKNDTINYTYSLSTGKDGFLYVGGTFDCPITLGTTTLSGTGHIKAYVAKYDTAGTALWGTCISGNDVVQLCSIAANNNNEVYVYGMHDCTGLTFGSTTLNYDGNYDLYLSKLNGPFTGIHENTAEQKMLLLYPNPNSGNFTITGNFTKGSKLILTDMLGREVYSQELTGGKNQIIHALSQGFYTYTILQNRNITHSGKMVVD